MPMRARLMLKRKAPRGNQGGGQNYETTWYCKRLSGRDTFPDGKRVPVGKWKTLKPIWVKLGEGLSWGNAITFGPAKEQLYDAADSFGAKKIVWLEEKSRETNSRYFQDTQYEGRRGAVNNG